MTRKELHAAIVADLRRGLTDPLTADAVIRLVVEACCETIRPKGPRPCDCDTCYCHNSGDLAAVTAWDEASANATALRTTFLPPEATDGTN